jgi:hypothetical protein
MKITPNNKPRGFIMLLVPIFIVLVIWFIYESSKAAQ